MDDEILGKVIATSFSSNTYKAIALGAEHTKVPNNVAGNPVIVVMKWSAKQ